MVDTEGCILKAFVSAANLSEQEGLFGILDTSIEEMPILKKIWADSGYQGEYAQNYCISSGIELEIVKRTEKGFHILPRRWVVERTFAWLGKQRRMSKDYEFRLGISESMIYMGMTRLMIRRAAHAITL